MFTNFCLKELCGHRVSSELGPTVQRSILLLYKCVYMCVILIFVHVYAFVCMSAILDVFVSDISVAFSLTWKGLGIMLMTLSGWFDLVMGSDVYNSNWTFIALNLPKQEDSKAQQNKKQ